jgi:signal transduction histidine kinase
MDVSLDVEGEPDALPTIVDWSAYRVVQEALTNVAKYAPDARVAVTLRYTPTAVQVDVEDIGGTPSAGHAGSRVGRGLVGMRERVSFLGGEFDARSTAGGGFAVHARFPHEGGST